MTQLELARMIRDDCDTDTDELEGRELSGPLMAEQFGLVRAMVAALASILIEQMEKEEA